MFRYCFITLTFIISFFMNAAASGPVAVIIDDLSGKNIHQVYFPGGTTFEVLDQYKQPILPQATDSGYFMYEGDLLLQVFPSYRKDKAEIFNLKDRRLRIFTTDEAARAAGYGYEPVKRERRPKNERSPSRAKQITDHNGRYTGSVKANSALSRSEKYPGKYNLTLTFTNGIVFTYDDGKIEAKLDGKELPVEDRYIVRSKLGTAKFSFDPENGEVWYVFVPNER